MTDPPESNAHRRAGQGAEGNDNSCHAQSKQGTIADLPMTMAEIGEHLGSTVRDVVECMQQLAGRSLIDHINLDFVPGVHTQGFVPTLRL